MIKAKDIHKSYGDLAILKGVNLQIDKGKIVSLYGSSGSGKTTLLNILGTLDSADNGFIQIGEMKRYFGHWKFVKANIGQRFLNYIIDFISISILSFLIGLIIGFVYYVIYHIYYSLTSNYIPVRLQLDWINYIVSITLVLITFAGFYLYYFLMESKFHITLGKLITKTLVIHKNGLYPSRDTILFRTLSRFIPFEAISIFFSSKNDSWHDKISQSIVIDKEKNLDFLKELNSSKIKSENDLCSFRNQSIGFIFQFHNLLPEFTALENVCMPGYLKGDDKTFVENKAKELLMTLDLADKFDKFPSQLSGGELQRVAVARALINNPQIVLADEPSGNLDSKNAEYLHQLFVKLRDKFGFTFFIVTHNEYLAEISDTVLHLRDGIIQNRI